MATAPESNLALTLPAPHSSSSSSSSNYEVFLSFRGPDTRKTFTDHLYMALKHKGIRTFRDEEELEIGEPIKPNLLKSIQESRISIPIISPDYASSRSCLEELAKIMECKQTIGQIVMPIFYHVDVGDVKNQTGSFAKPFCSHEKRFQMDKVMEWRNALKQVGKLKGYDSKTVESGYEARLVQKVLTEVLNELDNTTHNMDVAKYPIGIDSCVEDMLRLLDVGSQDVRFVGVHGMGGLGKTTIAKAVFNKIHRLFDGSSFIRDVREEASRNKGLVDLQNKLVCDILNLETNPISNVENVIKRRMSAKKVLVILDDVDKKVQLDALAGKPDWFGLGSRIIITTRDEDVLNVPFMDNKYMPKELSQYHSLQLFSWHAFGTGQPPKGFFDLSKKMASVAGGLPLVLEVLGSSLYEERRPEAWEETLEKLKRVPKEDIHNKLIISYDTLDVDQKKMFLDIACLLIGTEENIATEIWKGCGLSPLTGIKALVQKSLVTIPIWDNKLRMHDQLRDMGRAIVYKECPLYPEKRSRLWCHEEVLDVLANPKGTENIEGLTVSVKGDVLTTEAFANMSKLRLLRVEGARLVGNFEDLPPQLIWLCLKGCVLDFKLNRFHLEKLVVLDLSETNIVRIDWHQNKKVAANLKVISLSGCLYLEEFPPSICNLASLESLDLGGCYKLTKLPSRLGVMESLTELLFSKSAIEQLPDSIGLLKNLKRLDLNGCGSLTRLPDSIGSLKKLETLSASACRLLTMLPNSIGAMESLTGLFFYGSGIEQLPDSIGSLKNLKSLDLEECRSLTRLPDSLGKLESLGELWLGVTPKLNIMGSTVSLKFINNMRNLTCLSFTGITITELPDALVSLEKLKTLYLFHCKKLVKLPDSMGKLKRLQTFGVWESSIVELPKDFVMLSSLKDLGISYCQEFKCFPDIFGSLTQLTSLRLENNSKLTVLPPSLSCLSSLKELNVSHCNLPDVFGELSSLEILELGYNNFHSLPTSISGISLLQELSLRNCRELAWLPELPSSLTKLDLTNCISMETLPDLSNLKRLRELRLVNCDKLPEIQGLQRLESLEILHMAGCSTFANTLRKSLSQGVFKGLCSFSFPGSEIPKWFTHQEILSSEVLRVGNSDDEIEGLILCSAFAIDENRDDLHQPYGTTFIPYVALQIWSDHKLIYLEPLFIENIPKAQQDNINLQYINKDYGQFFKKLKYGDQIQISTWSQLETLGFHGKKTGVHVVYKPKEGFNNDEIESAIEEDSHEFVSIAEKLFEFFTSSACSCGVNEGESTSVKGANKRGRDDEDEVGPRTNTYCIPWKRTIE